MDGKQFIETMRRGWHKESGDPWGPHLPMVRERGVGVRELRAAYAVAGLAAGLEAAQKGMGSSLLRRFAEEPEEICPPYPPWPFPEPPPGPHPPEPPLPYDRALLGAALVFSADFLKNEDLSELATALGTELVG